MPQHDVTPRKARRWGISLALTSVAVLVLSGCNTQLKNGYLPDPVTEQGRRVTDLWVGGWLALLLVGAIVWGLILWCVVRYRKKDGDDTLPVQLQYNVPLELLYTVIPIFMVAVFFAFTARDEAILTETSATPDVTINVIGKQWSWDFNYPDANVYQAGVQTQLDANGNPTNEQPVLYIPMGKTTQFVLNSRDVVHSFWVPQFHMKLDMFPGKTNKFEVTPTETGEWQGKCAELCGAYHSQMLFIIKVVPQAEFDKQMAALKAKGNVGQLSIDDSRQKLLEPDQKLMPTPNTSGSN